MPRAAEHFFLSIGKSFGWESLAAKCRNVGCDPISFLSWKLSQLLRLLFAKIVRADIKLALLCR
jgi:hypothetical protein